MEITKIKYFPIDRTSDKHPLVVCSVVFDGVFMVHDIKIYSGGIVVMPQKLKSSREYTSTNNKNNKDLCHPIDRDFFFKLKNLVLEGYAHFSETGEVSYEPLGIEYV